MTDANRPIKDSLTTEWLDVPDALELIAKWLREGREIESKNMNGKYPTEFTTEDRCDSTSSKKGFISLDNYIYRAKPRKPRVVSVDDQRVYLTFEHGKNTRLIELTPEVIASGKRDGWL